MIKEKIHPSDTMFVDSYEHYFNVGAELSSIISECLDIKLVNEVKILELPCGFGRVRRHLINCIPSENITTVDISDEAIEFQSLYFNTQAIKVMSNDFIYKSIPNDFDIGIMGSLITHFDETYSFTILKNFLNKIKKDGLAIITTHGQKSYELLKQSNIYQISDNDRDLLLKSFEKNEFGFCEYENSHTFEKLTTEITGSSYGISIIPHSWIDNFCKLHGIEITNYIVGGWDNHQDVYILRKN